MSTFEGYSNYKVIGPGMGNFSTSELKLTATTMSFNAAAAAELGYPEVVIMMASPDAKYLLVQVYDEAEAKEFNFLPIVVEPLTKEEAKTLPTLGQVTAIAGSTRKSSKPYQRTIVCQRHLSGPIILPNIFCTKYDIQKNDTLRTELHDGKLYIYGRPYCDVCNSTDPKKAVTVSICGECANVEEDVRKAIESSGNVPDAVLASKAALQAAMDKLAAYEGRI